jgi:hypothetical protein
VHRGGSLEVLDGRRVQYPTCHLIVPAVGVRALIQLGIWRHQMVSRGPRVWSASHLSLEGLENAGGAGRGYEKTLVRATACAVLCAPGAEPDVSPADPDTCGHYGLCPLFDISSTERLVVESRTFAHCWTRGCPFAPEGWGCRSEYATDRAT